MRRTIEKLNREREKKEKSFLSKIDELDIQCKEIESQLDPLKFQSLFSRLEELLSVIPPRGERRRRPFRKGPSDSTEENTQDRINNQVFLILSQLQDILFQNLEVSKTLLKGLAEMGQLSAGLMDAKDEEWNALSNNHVGMIFKSMEWRVEQLAASYEDASILMKKFLLLKEKLTQLTSVLEEKDMPTPTQIREITGPLEDWRYAGFENRYRGSVEDVKEQLSQYLDYFSAETRVLDLGCGRGEFVELLLNKGLDAEGVDLNEQMIEICREKGLNCRKADILETLIGCEDGSLGGIFSSQVIEHLPPDYLKRMVELAYFKLAPSGHIVLETVNPTSVFTLVQIYYLDMSHQMPIHPQALKFLVESVGFEDVEIIYSAPLEDERLRDLPSEDEHSVVFNQNIDKLNDLLFAPSNFAVIGRKK